MKLEHEKMKMLADDYGYSSVNEMANESMMESVTPAICMNADCQATFDMEPDQDRGWCSECETNTVKSIYVLMGIM